MSHVLLCSYFYAKLRLGTPPREYSTIIDTGSTMTYIPCANCQHCGKHMVCTQQCWKQLRSSWAHIAQQKCHLHCTLCNLGAQHCLSNHCHSSGRCVTYCTGAGSHSSTCKVVATALITDLSPARQHIADCGGSELKVPPAVAN